MAEPWWEMLQLYHLSYQVHRYTNHSQPCHWTDLSNLNFVTVCASIEIIYPRARSLPTGLFSMTSLIATVVRHLFNAWAPIRLRTWNVLDRNIICLCHNHIQAWGLQRSCFHSRLSCFRVGEAVSFLWPEIQRGLSQEQSVIKRTAIPVCPSPDSHCSWVAILALPSLKHSYILSQLHKVHVFVLNQTVGSLRTHPDNRLISVPTGWTQYLMHGKLSTNA